MLMKGMLVDLCINLLAFPSLFIFKNKLFYFNLKNRSHTPQVYTLDLLIFKVFLRLSIYTELEQL